MTAPVTEPDNRWDRLFEPLAQHMRAYDDNGHFAGIRRDVLSALNFMVINLRGDALVHPEQIPVAERFIVFRTPTVHDAVRLFWNMYHRLYAPLDAEDRPEFAPDLSAEDAERTIHELMNPPAPASSAELDGLLLESLDWVYEKFQVPYEPDSDNAEKVLDLVIELHIAAARAFKLKQLEINHMSEELVSSLHSVERTVQRINAIASPHGSPFWDPSFALSTKAIWGMTQLELSRVSRAEGSYTDALHYLEEGSKSYVYALDGREHHAIQALDGIDVFGGDFDATVGRHGGNPWTSSLDWEEEAIRNEEKHERRDLRNRLTPLQLSLEESASLFNSLKDSSSADANWRQITDSCYWFSILPLMDWEVFTGVNDFIYSEEMQGDLSWSEFWLSARTWSSAQLSPSEYRKMRDDDERDAAQRRLSNYFFGSTWSSLPERAQESLISADSTWSSLGRMRRESILNELLRATEEMCERFVFQALMNEESIKSPILSIEAKVADNHRSLGVHEYIEICELSSLPSLLSERSLAGDEIDFLVKRLPIALRQLVEGRNTAEHELGVGVVPSQFVTTAYRMFLGIGQPGILPQLAQIGLTLQRHHPPQGR